MPGPSWSSEELERLKRGAENGESDVEIARDLPLRGPNAVRVKRKNMGLLPEGQARAAVSMLTRVVSDSDQRIVYAPAETAEEPIEEVWGRAVTRCDRAVAKGKYEGLALVQIVSDKPVAFSISSDWHISTTGACALPELREYAEAIQRTPGAYAVAVGDLHDNPIKWSKNMSEVPDELRIVDLIFGIFGSKLLGTTDGNHEAWSRMFAGVDNIRCLAERKKIHYAPDELVYVVELLDPGTLEQTARYVVATRHKFRRASQLNLTHSCWRWLEERVGQWPMGDDGTLVPDILAIGDSHVAAVEERAYENKTIWGARMGPWQTSSSFARSKGFVTYRTTAPTFLLYPHHEKPIDGYADYKRALEVLALERAVPDRA